ncbi:MAG: SDR family oxidoreductase [Pseudolabrys sp.]|nr:SDR family oxidoreductase [Pseudolabrys sp.]
MSDKELAGKVAVVTGAGRNIGRAIALALAEAGATVVVNARANRAEADAVVAEIVNKGGSALTQLGDVADPGTAEALAALAASRLKRIDILVNNAALRNEKPIDEMSYADWRAVLAVTLDGAFHCSKACLPWLKRNGGTIVNIGGMSAHIGSSGRVHVMTAKAGIVGFTRGLAHDLAGDNITVNCVVPGAVATARLAGTVKPAHHLTHGAILGRRGSPGDVAALVRFLAGPGGRFITGQTIHINGGAYHGS